MARFADAGMAGERVIVVTPEDVKTQFGVVGDEDGIVVEDESFVRIEGIMRVRSVLELSEDIHTSRISFGFFFD